MARNILGIDINADLGEGFPEDEALLERVGSANIACGAHAGSPGMMYATLQAARIQKVRVGAHPGYYDADHFGRRELQLPWERLWADLVFQLSGFLNLADLAGVRVIYLKPHGALYTQACRDSKLAELVVAAADRCALAVMGLPDSALEAAARRAGRIFLREGFLDRRIGTDGMLVPRTQANAFLTDPAEALTQARKLRDLQKVDSFCIHGDGLNPCHFLDQLFALEAATKVP